MFKLIMVIGLGGVQYGPRSASFDLFNHEYDYRPNWTTRSSVTLDYSKICDFFLGLFK